MRAILLRKGENLSVGSTLILDDDRASHLIKVIRIKKDEKLLVLDGHGRKIITQVSNLNKKSVELVYQQETFEEKSFSIDLFLGIPKREAFELSLKNAVEVGYYNIFPFDAEYSQWKIKNNDRVTALIESAVIQSNNPYFPVVQDIQESIYSLDNVIDNYDYILLTTLQNKDLKMPSHLDSSKKYLIIIGPEGGLSQKEEDYVLEKEKTLAINLPLPILRTQNAVTTIAGFLHGKFAGL